MEDLKAVVAANIIKLRNASSMTQAQLGEKLSYSDKTISKWERAEALPDAVALKTMSEIFSVSVDDLLNPGTQWVMPKTEKEENYSRKAITWLSLAGIWTAAVFTFVVLWMCGIIYWMTFVYAVPVSLITLLVLNAAFGRSRWHFPVVAGLVASIFLTVYLALMAPYNPWQLLLVLVPAELVVAISFQIRKKKRKKQ